MVDRQISHSRHEGFDLIILAGEHDVYTAPLIRQYLMTSESECAALIIDMTAVTFMNSSVLGVLVGSLKRLSKAGKVQVLVITKPGILKMFEVTGLVRVFTIVDSRSKAVDKVLARVQEECK